MHERVLKKIHLKIINTINPVRATKPKLVCVDIFKSLQGCVLCAFRCAKKNALANLKRYANFI